MDNPPIFSRREIDSVVISCSTTPMSRFGDEFCEKEEIGRGGFGKVFKAKWLYDGKCYAVKRIPLHIRKDKDRPLREVDILQKLSHPCIISYKGHWEESGLKWKRERRDRTDIKNYSTSLEDTWSNKSSSKVESSGGVSFRSATQSRGLAQEMRIGYRNIDATALTNPKSLLESEALSKDLSSLHLHTAKSTSNLPDSDFNIFAARMDQSSNESSQSRILMQPDSEGSSSGSIRGSTGDIQETFLYIQMELCYYGEEEENQNDEFTLKQALLNLRDKLHLGSIFKQVVDGIEYIHEQGILHRDIKPANVFFVDRSLKKIKIGDLGIARNFDQEGGDNIWKYSPNVGTDSYMSPEILALDGNYDIKTDIYSLGLLTFELFFPISSGAERSALFADLRQDKPKFPEGDHLNSEKVELITSMLQKDKSQRPSAQEIKQSNVYKSIVVAVTEGTSD